MSADSIITIHWGTAVPGRESIGLEMFMSAMQHYNGLKVNNELDDVITVGFDQGDLSHHWGMMMIKGSKSQIEKVLDSEKHRELLTKAMHIVTEFRVNVGVTGDRMMSRIQDVTKWRKELGL